MHAQVEKPKENKSRAVANSSIQGQNNMQVFGFVDNRPKSVVQTKMQTKINKPIQLMKKWTLAAGLEDIEVAPVDGEDKKRWLRCKYEGEEIYIESAEMEGFNQIGWDKIEFYDSDVSHDEEFEQKEDELKKDEFPDYEVGEVTSITIIQENRSDHMYVIVMVKGGGNIKIHYGTNGGLYDKSDEIDNQHGIPRSIFKVPKGLTGDQVTEIFNKTKKKIEEKFTGGNCGECAAELVGEIGGESTSNFFE